MFISHWLDISFETLVHVVEFKLFLFFTIRYKTGLDKIITSELDTGKAATILRYTKFFLNIGANHILDEICKWVLRIKVCRFVVSQVTSFARSAIFTIYASSVDQDIITWQFKSTSLADFKATNIIADFLSQHFYWFAKNDGNNTR